MVRDWIAGIGVDTVGKKLVNSKEGPPSFEQPKMSLEKLLEYGNMLVQEQENVKRVQLADKYLKEAALGDANCCIWDLRHYRASTASMSLQPAKNK